MEKLAVLSCTNVRDLGGHATPHGPTRAHRFVRCGSTSGLLPADLERMRAWGVTRVLDLRGPAESPRITCGFSRQPGIVWENVPLYDVDISAGGAGVAGVAGVAGAAGAGPAAGAAVGLAPTKADADNYLVTSYLEMLTSPRPLCRIFAFLAEAGPRECVLFHCAAGMDRTGMVAMLLLGLAGVPRDEIIIDYACSFGSREEVIAELARQNAARIEPERAEDAPMRFLLQVRVEAIATVYDRLIQAYGSVAAFLSACGVADKTLLAVRAHLLEDEPPAHS